MGIFSNFDGSINSMMNQGVRTPCSIKAMEFITSIGDKLVLGILSLLLIGFLLYRKKTRKAIVFTFAMFFGTALVYIFKSWIMRPRPPNSLIEVSHYSFPSGHATLSIIFFAFFIYAFQDEIKSRIIRSVFRISNITLILLIGFSRIFLNVHWATDVLAGYFLGLFWIFTAIKLEKHLKKRKRFS